MKNESLLFICDPARCQLRVESLMQLCHETERKCDLLFPADLVPRGFECSNNSAQRIISSLPLTHFLALDGDKYTALFFQNLRLAEKYTCQTQTMFAWLNIFADSSGLLPPTSIINHLTSGANEPRSEMLETLDGLTVSSQREASFLKGKALSCPVQPIRTCSRKLVAQNFSPPPADQTLRCSLDFVLPDEMGELQFFTDKIVPELQQIFPKIRFLLPTPELPQDIRILLRRKLRHLPFDFCGPGLPPHTLLHLAPSQQFQGERTACLQAFNADVPVIGSYPSLAWASDHSGHRLTIVNHPANFVRKIQTLLQASCQEKQAERQRTIAREDQNCSQIEASKLAEFFDSIPSDSVHTSSEPGITLER